MNAPNRILLRLLLGISLTFVLTTHIVQGQVTRPGANLPPPIGTSHHVTGRVNKGECSISLNSAKLQVVEFWYTRTGAGNSTLVLPTHPTNGSRDPLSFQLTPLVQGRVLGEVTLTGDAATFDVQWLESAHSNRVPWAENVQNGRTGEITTAYRLLSLQVKFGTNTGMVAKIDPVPLISFFGTEIMKNVGRIKVGCFSISG